MNIKKLIYRLKPPCPKCPYKLGLIKTIVNPCPGCKDNGYLLFERFQREVPGGYPVTSNEDQ